MLLSSDLGHCLGDVGPDLDHESAICMWALVREARRGAGAGAGAEQVRVLLESAKSNFLAPSDSEVQSAI